jgi:alpha-glucosidase
LLKGEIAFHDAPDPVVAFTREHDDARLLCVFNLGETGAGFDVSGFGPVRPLEGHGFTAERRDDRVSLDAFDAFFATY